MEERARAPGAPPSEPRWPAVMAILGIGGLYAGLPEFLTPGPSWLLLVLLVPISAAALILHWQRKHRLMVSYPGQKSSATLPFTCSSVDILPFIYTLALGNDSWRSYPDDIIYYLNRREAINDAIYEYVVNSDTQLVPQRRLSSIALSTMLGAGNQPWEIYQPFVLHTADDYATAYYINPTTGMPTSTQQPSHAIAFRTVDQTTSPSGSNGANNYGGGKLGSYSYWNTCDPTPSGAPIMPISTANGGSAPHAQFEFYYYSPYSMTFQTESDPSEMSNYYLATSGNGPPYSITPGALAYYNDFFNIDQDCTGCINPQNELYNLNVPCGAGAPTTQVQAAIQIAYANYILYLTCTGQITGSTGQPLTASTGTCPVNPDSGTGQECPTCASDTTCPPSYTGQP